MTRSYDHASALLGIFLRKREGCTRLLGQSQGGASLTGTVTGPEVLAINVLEVSC